jgi:hypothetical protein
MPRQVAIRTKLTDALDKHVLSILTENEKRIKEINLPFSPIKGEGCGDKRFLLFLPDFPIQKQHLPMSMKKIPLVKMLLELGSCKAVIEELHEDMDEPYNLEEEMEQLVEQFTRIRMKHDPFFFFAMFIYIKPKGGGLPFRFVLRRPQRRLLRWLEERRKKNRPIRLILLKARQWGGSTVIQMYMLWMQLMWEKGLNSLIVAQVKDTAETIRGMFEKALKKFPTKFLYEMGEAYSENEPKFVGVGTSGNVKEVPQRFCKIKVGSMERPLSANGEDYNLVHLSEVGLWKKTDGKSPEEVVQNATNGILYRPYTMIVYESTANGTGNFFHKEWIAAKKGESQFEPFFVPWFEIYDMYHLDFETKKQKVEFAKWLYENRNNSNTMSDREEPGTYLWKLWTLGAPLEAINWYMAERKKFTDHADMAAGYPTDDIEAFKHSGAKVFAEDKVDKFRKGCRAPKFIGDVYGDGYKGKKCMQNVRFCEDKQGQLWIWSKPEYFDDCRVTNRYLVVVDIGGRSKNADWSVICVFDRYWMMEGGKPYVVAQWYGHIDMDLLAWKAAQIAKYYDNALLVIESNTLETKDKEHILEGGDQSEFILNQIKDVYDNLYARKQSEADIKEGVPRKYGFHTNVATKPMVISVLVQVVREHLYVERDQRCLNEFLTYERKKNGAYGAIDGKHDDLLMTRAIGLHICFNEMEMPKMIQYQARVMRKKVSVSAATII